MTYCADHKSHPNHCWHCPKLAKIPFMKKEIEQLGLPEFQFLGCKRCLSIFLKNKNYVPLTLIDDEVHQKSNEYWLCKEKDGRKQRTEHNFYIRS